MGVFGFIGNALKTLAPAAAFIPGVGPLAAAGLAAGGHALGDAIDGDGRFNLGGSLAAGGTAGLGKYALGKIPGGQMPSIKVPIQGPDGSIIGYRDLTPSANSLGGLLNGNTIPIAAGVLGGISAAGKESKANALTNEALASARADYASRAPLRERAVNILSGQLPTPPNLSGLHDRANPFAPSPISLASSGPQFSLASSGPQSGGLKSGFNDRPPPGAPSGTVLNRAMSTLFANGSSGGLKGGATDGPLVNRVSTLFAKGR